MCKFIHSADKDCPYFLRFDFFFQCENEYYTHIVICYNERNNNVNYTQKWNWHESLEGKNPWKIIWFANERFHMEKLLSSK